MTELNFEPQNEVSTGELDFCVKEMKALQQDYDRKKEVSTEAYHLWKKKQEEVLEMLQKAGKSTYIVEDIGRVTLVDKLKVRTPKSPQDKARFFQWLKENEGADGFLTYATVNYNSLNSLYKQHSDAASEKGEVFEGIAGVEPAESETELRFKSL